jgi:hypothetical protein
MSTRPKKAAQNKLNDTCINKTKLIFIRKNHTKPNLKNQRKNPHRIIAVQANPEKSKRKLNQNKHVQTKPIKIKPNQTWLRVSSPPAGRASAITPAISGIWSYYSAIELDSWFNGTFLLQELFEGCSQVKTPEHRGSLHRSFTVYSFIVPIGIAALFSATGSEWFVSIGF